MFDYQLVRVEKKIDKLFRQGVFRDRKIYLFGVSENSRQIIQILRTYQIEPANVMDNDRAKQGSYCSRVRVVPIDGVEDLTNGRNLYIVCSLYWREMAVQLQDRGIRKENIILLYHVESLLEHYRHAVSGKRIYDELLSKYGKVPMFVCPYTGTGDIYLIGTFWRQYLERNHIEDYVFLVITKACEKVTRLFGIKNVVVFKKKMECACLIQYHMLCPQKVNITLLNDSWYQIHTNPLEWFRGYKGLEFTELFRRFVFELPDGTKPEHPLFPNVDSKLDAIFQEKHLQAGNTVVLSPFSNTLADLPNGFWVGVAKRLQQQGFTVCTNSGGEAEPAVEGTAAVFCSLEIAPQFVERAGYFVGVRSGFCDIVSGSKAKKVILYDARNRFFNSSAYEYFSLRTMGLCKDAIEIQFEQADEQLQDEVVSRLKMR
ncbi:MAG: hypothetical protein HFH82_09105 [Lachnospiraceae bacterium]|nr:hypothetical protein [Lachnospiraceae bacterium]